MAAYQVELTVLDELENAFYQLTETCWFGLSLVTLAWVGILLVANILNMAWNTHFDPTLSITTRTWLVAFILGSGGSLLLENRDPFSGGWSRTFWWTPFATVLAGFWLYLML